jgi:cold shock CspA family protein
VLGVPWDGSKNEHARHFKQWRQRRTFFTAFAYAAIPNQTILKDYSDANRSFEILCSCQEIWVHVQESDGPDLFVHAGAFVDHQKAQPGDKLTYEIGTSKDGRPCTIDVRLIDPHQAAVAASVFSKLDGDYAQEEAAAAFRIDARYS